MQAIAQTAAVNAYELSPLSLASTAWACMSMSIICFPLLDVMAKILFRSPVDDGIATMAIWTLSRLPDLDLAFQLVHSAQWRIPPLSLSALLEACEQRDISQLRVLRLLAHGHLKPVVLDLLDTMEANSCDRTVKSSDGSLEPWDLSEENTDPEKCQRWFENAALMTSSLFASSAFFQSLSKEQLAVAVQLICTRHDILESEREICNFHGAFSIATWILCPHVVRPRFGQGPTQWDKSHQRCCAQIRFLFNWWPFNDQNWWCWWISSLILLVLEDVMEIILTHLQTNYPIWFQFQFLDIRYILLPVVRIWVFSVYFPLESQVTLGITQQVLDPFARSGPRGKSKVAAKRPPWERWHGCTWHPRYSLRAMLEYSSASHDQTSFVWWLKWWL